jgi:gamma-D-glutamyl-L-lysine dipeptidyl-peptidase
MMPYAVVNVPAAPVRKKAMHQSEMINQLLFGEAVEILEKKGKRWLLIRSLHDGYKGWIANNLIDSITAEQAKVRPEYVSANLINTIKINKESMTVPLGSSLPFYKNGKGHIGNAEYVFKGAIKNINEITADVDAVKKLTRPWLNAPYLWGGRTILGVDCSGFVQVVFNMMGLQLPRDARLQAKKGKRIKNLENAITGDLAFFNDKEEIVHVGILLSNKKIIHASGRVRIDAIDKKGIINSTTGKRTHVLHLIKRYW